MRVEGCAVLSFRSFLEGQRGVYEIVVDGVDQVQEWACGPPPPHGRAKAGPYSNIRPAEAGAGRYALLLAKSGFLQRFHTPTEEGGCGKVGLNREASKNSAGGKKVAR